jgi:hypothetical protein
MSSDIVKSTAAWDENAPPLWLDKINITELEKLAGVGFTPEKVAMYFDVPKIEFMYYFMLEGSKLKYHYDRGVLYYQAKDGLSMLEDADQNAAQAARLDKLRDNVQFRNAIEEIFYGGI